MPLTVTRASAEMPSHRSLGTIAAMGVTMGSGVSGCTVGPEYQRPPIALEAFHSVGAVAARGAGNPAPPLDAWWIGSARPPRTGARGSSGSASAYIKESALARWPRQAGFARKNIRLHKRLVLCGRG